MCFHKERNTEFTIVAIYVNNLILTRILEELNKTINYLKNELEIKNFGKSKEKINNDYLFINIHIQKNIKN